MKANLDIDSVIEHILETKNRSTQVNYWYDHGAQDGTLRGPFHRWFKCTDVDPAYRSSVASVHDEVTYAAAAMNYAPYIAEEYLKLKQMYEELKAESILLKE